MNGVREPILDDTIPPPKDRPKRAATVRGLGGKSAAAGIGLVGATKVADVLLRGLDRLDPGLTEMLGADAIHWVAGAVILPAVTYSVKYGKRVWDNRVIPAARRRAAILAETVA